MTGNTYNVLNVRPKVALRPTADHPARPWFVSSNGDSIRWYRDKRDRLYARIVQVDRYHPEGEVHWYGVTDLDETRGTDAETETTSPSA